MIFILFPFPFSYRCVYVYTEGEVLMKTPITFTGNQVVYIME